MTLCPQCNTRPAYVGLTEIGPCEQCHMKSPAAPLVVVSSATSPLGLIGSDLRDWCRRHPDVVVLAQESDTGIEYRIQGWAMLRFKFPNSSWTHLRSAFNFTENVTCTGV